MRKILSAIAATIALVHTAPVRAEMPIPMRAPVQTGYTKLAQCTAEAGAKLQRIEVAVSAAASAARLDTQDAQQSLTDDEWRKYLVRARTAANNRKTALTNARNGYRVRLSTCTTLYGASK